MAKGSALGNQLWSAVNKVRPNLLSWGRRYWSSQVGSIEMANSSFSAHQRLWKLFRLKSKLLTSPSPLPPVCVCSRTKRKLSAIFSLLSCVCSEESSHLRPLPTQCHLAAYLRTQTQSLLRPGKGFHLEGKVDFSGVPFMTHESSFFVTVVTPPTLPFTPQ